MVKKMTSPVPSPEFILIQQRRRRRSISMSRLMECAPRREDVLKAIAGTPVCVPNPEEAIRADGFSTFLHIAPPVSGLPIVLRDRGDYLEELFSPLLLEALAHVDAACAISDFHEPEAPMTLLQAYISAQWTIGARDAAMHLYGLPGSTA